MQTGFGDENDVVEGGCARAPVLVLLWLSFNDEGIKKKKKKKKRPLDDSFALPYGVKIGSNGPAKFPMGRGPSYSDHQLQGLSYIDLWRHLSVASVYEVANA